MWSQHHLRPSMHPYNKSRDAIAPTHHSASLFHCQVVDLVYGGLKERLPPRKVVHALVNRCLDASNPRGLSGDNITALLCCFNDLA